MTSRRRRAGQVAPLLLAVALLACTGGMPLDEAALVGRYAGTGYGDPVPRPVPLKLLLRADGRFTGNLPTGPGGFPVRTGRWRFLSGDESTCPSVEFRPLGEPPTHACLRRRADDTICLTWTTYVAETCDLTRLPAAA